MLIKSLGVVVLLHAAYGTIKFREANPDSLIESPPQEILLQLVVGFVIALVGTLYSLPPLGVVRGNSSKKENPKYVKPPPSSRSRDFDIFNHRMMPN
ncbi:hypothetical protein TrCOL_g6733 [Triparma columacea]|uniref:Membrane magnesium transporter n=1 Tax=Triparma columacea TaxID=722753 RepID=A0A9W7G7T3_9STRA|nr:hypothetical protein TrCOL_g6733 [Triparma columacea]